MTLPDRYRAACLVAAERIEMRSLPLSRPQWGELLVRIEVATTCGTDLKVYLQGGHPRMLRVPSAFGHECVGTVVAVGGGVQDRRPGETVVVLNSSSCGNCTYCARGRENLCRDLHYLNGAFAEFLTVPERFVTGSTYPVPAGLSPEHACLTEPLACVLHGLEACCLAEPRDVVVLGAGPIGQLLVGALSVDRHRVVSADPSAGRRQTALQMGAVAAVEPYAPEASEAILDLAADRLGFDLAIDATGTVAGWELAADCVRPGGEVLYFGGCPTGTRVTLDTARVHYDEIVCRGSYHHRPATALRALELLASHRMAVDLLLSQEMSLELTEEALHSMKRRDSLKVVIRPWAQSFEK